MEQYFLYYSKGNKLPWHLLRDNSGRAIIHLSAELVSVRMMRLKLENPALDYMFYRTRVSGNPPETLVRRCGCQ